MRRSVQHLKARARQQLDSYPRLRGPVLRAVRAARLLRARIDHSAADVEYPSWVLTAPTARVRSIQARLVDRVGSRLVPASAPEVDFEAPDDDTDVDADGDGGHR